MHGTTMQLCFGCNELQNCSTSELSWRIASKNRVEAQICSRFCFFCCWNVMFMKFFNDRVLHAKAEVIAWAAAPRCWWPQKLENYKQLIQYAERAERNNKITSCLVKICSRPHFRLDLDFEVFVIIFVGLIRSNLWGEWTDELHVCVLISQPGCCWCWLGVKCSSQWSSSSS